MPVNIDIAKVAKLARVALSDEELELYGRQLGDILEHAELVQSLPTEGVPPTSHPLPMTNAFRSDEVTASLDRDEVLAQAPDHEDGYFRVPRILDDGDPPTHG
jgi:aspartyl-tRNA(Asn)/glutamyl-tRNA(Gln) amidotransferase subunit C